MSDWLRVSEWDWVTASETERVTATPSETECVSDTNPPSDALENSLYPPLTEATPGTPSEPPTFQPCPSVSPQLLPSAWAFDSE